jgi:cell division septation protein DedD
VTRSDDDGFHEIQLNGKQLVFLFMAATVVSVVIFLCGVLVGRGVRAERAAVDASAAALTETAQPAAVPPPSSPAEDPTKAEVPPQPSEKLTYFDLAKKKPVPEPLKPADKTTAKAETPRPAPKAEAPPPAPKPQVAAATATAGAAGEPTGQGFAVQIAALNVRSEADAIAKRLSSKGYSAYVLAPANGSPSVFRVRVGKFNTRREAEGVAARLQKEEQFKPWVTR